MLIFTVYWQLEFQSCGCIIHVTIFINMPILVFKYMDIRESNYILVSYDSNPSIYIDEFIIFVVMHSFSKYNMVIRVRVRVGIGDKLGEIRWWNYSHLTSFINIIWLLDKSPLILTYYIILSEHMHHTCLACPKWTALEIFQLA